MQHVNKLQYYKHTLDFLHEFILIIKAGLFYFSPNFPTQINVSQYNANPTISRKGVDLSHTVCVNLLTNEKVMTEKQRTMLNNYQGHLKVIQGHDASCW